MKSEPTLKFKIASEDWEFEAIHRLNYKTFVEEIPQHAHNPEQRLVDKLHAENTYAICLSGDRLVGMVTGRGNRPFSLDHKVPDLDSHLPPGHKVLEVRLLSVEKKTVVFVTHSIEEAVYLSDRIVLLSRRPSRVSEIIEPDIQRGDDPDAIRRHPAYLDTVETIWQGLKRYLD